MTHPFEMMQALRRAITPDGTWLLVDIKAHDTFALDASENPMASLMYGISVLSCMSSHHLRHGARRRSPADPRRQM
jgi:hypothetical protein